MRPNYKYVTGFRLKKNLTRNSHVAIHRGKCLSRGITIFGPRSISVLKNSNKQEATTMKGKTRIVHVPLVASVDSIPVACNDSYSGPWGGTRNFPSEQTMPQQSRTRGKMTVQQELRSGSFRLAGRAPQGWWLAGTGGCR